MSEITAVVGKRKWRRPVLIFAAVLKFLAIFAVDITFYMSPNPAPTELTLKNLKARDISISWKAVKNAESYYIYRMDEKRGRYMIIDSCKETKYTDRNLKPQTTYWYKVSAVRNGKEGRLSAAVKEVTGGLLSAPTGVVVEDISFSTALVRWEIVEEAEKYYIYRSEDETEKYKKIGESIGIAFQDTGLKPGEKYKYRITSINDDGESSFSSAAEAVTKEQPENTWQFDMNDPSEANKVNSRGNRGNNLVNGGLAAEQGDWIYYVDRLRGNTLYKMSKDGKTTQKLYEGFISNINVVGDWIYFNDVESIYRIRTDGSGLSKVRSDVVYNLYVMGDWIYYNTGDGIFRMKTNGSGRMKICSDDSSVINVEGDWVYYSNIGDKNRLYKVKTDGKGRVKLSSDGCGFINLSGEWIYYQNYSDNNAIYKIKIDGTAREKVLNERVNMFNITGDSIIFENLGFNGRLFRTDINGKNLVQLTDRHYNYINIIGNYIFCYDFNIYTLEKVRMNGVK